MIIPIVLLLASCCSVHGNNAWDYLKDLHTISEFEFISSPLASPNSGRIVNGTQARHGQFPFMAGLWRQRESRPFCGASLITSKWVLTAAHCVYGRSSRRLNVVLGDHNVKSKDSGEKTMKVCSVITHPYYSNHHTKDDIALLRLCKNVEFSPVIQPIALAKPHEALDRYQKVKVSGWGVTKEGGRTSTILMHVDVICAGVIGGGKDSCQGDSGGPLWALDEAKQTRMLVGVVSSGKGCARPRYPGIYTNVSEYYFWILETMAKRI